MPNGHSVGLIGRKEKSGWEWERDRDTIERKKDCDPKNPVALG